MGPLDTFAEVVEWVPGTRKQFAKKIICKICRNLCYEVSDTPTKRDVELETLRFSAHMGIHHQIDIIWKNCEKKSCAKKHSPGTEAKA